MPINVSRLPEFIKHWKAIKMPFPWEAFLIPNADFVRMYRVIINTRHAAIIMGRNVEDRTVIDFGIDLGSGWTSMVSRVGIYVPGMTRLFNYMSDETSVEEFYEIYNNLPPYFA